MTVQNLISSSWLALCLVLTACGGSGGSSGNGDPGGGNNTVNTPVELGPMNHPVSYDPKSDPMPAATGLQASSVFGGRHDNLKMVFNAAGNGLAVWRTESAAGIVKIVYATYNATSEEWSSEDTLFVVTDVNPPGSFDFSLAASDNGFAVAWLLSSVYEVTPENVQEWHNYSYAKVYENGQWSAAKLLNTSSKLYNLTMPLVSSNGESFLFVWEENFDIKSREWTASGMSSAITAYQITSLFNSDMVLVSNGSSYMLKFEEYVNYASSFMTAIEYASGGWGEADTTETSSGSISSSTIASDGSGYMMTWIQNMAAYYRHYNNGAWSAMTAIAAGPAGAHQLSSNGSSYLIAWLSASDLNVKTFDSGSWGTSQTPESITDPIRSFTSTATATGYAFSLRTQDTVASRYNLHLLNYTGGSSGTAVPAELLDFDVEDHQIAHGDDKTWLAWVQFDGTDMLVHMTAYLNENISIATSPLSLRQHGGGVTSGKVASTPLGVKVAAWSQSYIDATGNQLEAAFARVDNNSGSYGPTVFLRNYSSIRDVVAVGETLVVILNASSGLAVIEYSNGAWGSVTNLSSSVVYEWYAEVANGRLMIAWHGNRDIWAAVYEAGIWGDTTMVNTSGISTGSMHLASNNEDFMVSWIEFVNTGVNGRTINSRFYDAAVVPQWSDVAELDSYETNLAGFYPIITGSDSGFLIAWTRLDSLDAGSPHSLYASICGANGVCSVGAPIENYSTSVGSLQLASNGSGYMITFAYSAGQWSMVYNGTSWSNSIKLSDNSSVVRISGSGNDYLALWYVYGEGNSVNVSRYTSTNGWGQPDIIIPGVDGRYIYNMKFISVGNSYAVSWADFKPNQDYQKYDLFVSFGSGTQQVNTGKFTVSAYNYNYDVVNNSLRLSWVQAHESLLDPAAPALWEYVP